MMIPIVKLRDRLDVTAVINGIISFQVIKAGVTGPECLCYINISSDATCYSIIKSRLGACDADTASWPVSFSPLTILMFLYPAVCHCVTSSAFLPLSWKEV